MKTIIIDGKEYVEKSENTPAQTLDGLKYVIVRTYSAGVFAGYLESRKDRKDRLIDGGTPIAYIPYNL